MALEFASAPIRDPIAEPDAQSKKLMLPRVWIDWFASLGMRVETQTHQLNVIELFSQSGSVGATPIPPTALTEGLYKITYYTRVSVAASTSSSLQITLGWTDNAVSCFQTFPALTTNTVGTVQSNTIMVRNDQAAPLVYSVTYASAGGTAMQYNLFVQVEQVA